MSQRRTAPRQAALGSLYLAAIAIVIGGYLLLASLIGLHTAPAGRLLVGGALVLLILGSALALASGGRFRRRDAARRRPEGGAEHQGARGPAALEARRSF